MSNKIKYQNSDDEDDLAEIKRVQAARANKTKYTDEDEDEFDNFIPTSLPSSSSSKSKKDKKKKKHDKDDDDDEQRSTWQRELDSYSAPKEILDSIPIDEDNDPIKKYRAPTVAEQETEYRSRWRKRDLSPPRTYDPFTGKGEVKGRSYRDILIETQLAKEEKELELQMSKKLKEEKEKEQKKRKLEEYDNKYKTNHSGSSASSSSSNGKNRRWFYKVSKNQEIVEKDREIIAESPLTFGRDQGRNKVVLEHPSCSSVHAKITLERNGVRPILIDLNSTNQTFLNDKEIIPNKLNNLYEGDIIKFGASSREYIIYHD
ncbi:hypothetical protein CYY_000663 [Polysphondylium violaceum]|uniref:FHA domain-containing protein n=1 Tax=Polysphondylium violaceum TaxID=133409 RepID=A0A8J4Q3G0_9MYCE|nr:hypothetical protein CYY_000663 [Polysphondylium violaceum]